MNLATNTADLYGDYTTNKTDKDNYRYIPAGDMVNSYKYDQWLQFAPQNGEEINQKGMLSQDVKLPLKGRLLYNTHGFAENKQHIGLPTRTPVVSVVKKDANNLTFKELKSRLEFEKRKIPTNVSDFQTMNVMPSMQPMKKALKR